MVKPATEQGSGQRGSRGSGGVPGQVGNHAGRGGSEKGRDSAEDAGEYRIMGLADRYRDPSLSGLSSNDMLTISEWSKRVKVGGKTFSGWIGWLNRMGRPLKIYRGPDGVKRYRVGEVIAIAKATCSDFQRLVPPDDLDVVSLLKLGERTASPHQLSAADLSVAINSESLRTEAEIVERAKKSEVAGMSGVYFLVRNGRVIYVGQSTNVYGRVYYHMSQREKPFDSWCFVPCPPDRLDLIESLYIHSLKPKLNGRIGDKLLAPIGPDALIRHINLKGVA